MAKFDAYIMHDYAIDRDIYAELFKNVDDILWDKGWDFTGDYFKTFRIDDTFYMLNYESGILISHYKHLGRCNNSNFELSIEEYKKFSLDLSLDLEGKEIS